MNDQIQLIELHAMVRNIVLYLCGSSNFACSEGVQRGNDSHCDKNVKAILSQVDSTIDQHGKNHGQDHSIPGARSCAHPISNLETKHRQRGFLALRGQGLADQREFVAGNLAALAPVAHRRRRDACEAGDRGRSTQSFNNVVDCGQHAP